MKNTEFEDSCKHWQEDEDKDRMYIDYDDPSRYSVVSLQPYLDYTELEENIIENSQSSI